MYLSVYGSGELCLQPFIPYLFQLIVFTQPILAYTIRHHLGKVFSLKPTYENKTYDNSTVENNTYEIMRTK